MARRRSAYTPPLYSGYEPMRQLIRMLCRNDPSTENERFALAQRIANACDASWCAWCIGIVVSEHDDVIPDERVAAVLLPLAQRRPGIRPDWVERHLV